MSDEINKKNREFNKIECKMLYDIKKNVQLPLFDIITEMNSKICNNLSNIKLFNSVEDIIDCMFRVGGIEFISKKLIDMKEN